MLLSVGNPEARPPWTLMKFGQGRDNRIYLALHNLIKICFFMGDCDHIYEFLVYVFVGIALICCNPHMCFLSMHCFQIIVAIQSIKFWE